MRKITIEIIPEVEGTTHANCSDETIILEFFGKCLSGYTWKVLRQPDVISSAITDAYMDDADKRIKQGEDGWG